MKLLVSGGLGTGKTAVLTAARAALRSAGIPVTTSPAHAGDALVVDDAHLLADADLERLAALAAEPATTVIVAAEPLAHQPALRALTTTIERENPVVVLDTLDADEVDAAASAVLGVSPSAELARALMTATAGLPFLVRAALDALRHPEGDPAAAPTRAAHNALVERLRTVDEPVLDTLLVASLGPDLGADDVAAALRVGTDQARRLVDAARASGLIAPSHDPTFTGSVHRCVARVVGAARHREVEIALLRSQIELGSLTAELALRLCEHGLRDDRLAEALADLAGRYRSRPAQAARLYRAAVEAGTLAPSSELADALAMAGDCAGAGRLADELLGSADVAQRAAAVRIAASIALHDGSARQAAELFGWLGSVPDAAVGAAATVVALAAGEPERARAALAEEPAGPPTSAARTARHLGEGLLLSLDHPYPVAVARLGQSIGTAPHSPAVAPDTPAALLTLAAVHGGDPVRARSVIGRAVHAAGDEGAFVIPRHRLLQGWVRMLDGHLGAAAADAGAVGTAGLHRRDALWAAALQTAIARRSGDTGAMAQHWYTAMEVLAEYSVDLFSLLPVGELWVAAARLRQVDRLGQVLAEAFGVLDALGNPVLWSVPLRWAGVHAGILANSPEAVAPHGQALAAAGQDGRVRSTLARVLAHAGRTWLRVLADQVDADEVTSAARGLAECGLTWDATRLASQAALHTPDSRASGAMLALARDLKQQVPEPDGAEAPPVEPVPVRAGAPARTAPRPAAKLSDREREVAELLLLGMPYRDIGNQLFISAKTVEHHVARIRRRLGAESRSEMLSMLRAMLTVPH